MTNSKECVGERARGFLRVSDFLAIVISLLLFSIFFQGKMSPVTSHSRFVEGDHIAIRLTIDPARRRKLASDYEVKSAGP